MPAPACSAFCRAPPDERIRLPHRSSRRLARRRQPCDGSWSPSWRRLVRRPAPPRPHRTKPPLTNRLPRKAMCATPCARRASPPARPPVATSRAAKAPAPMIAAVTATTTSPATVAPLPFVMRAASSPSRATSSTRGIPSAVASRRRYAWPGELNSLGAPSCSDKQHLPCARRRPFRSRSRRRMPPSRRPRSGSPRCCTPPSKPRRGSTPDNRGAVRDQTTRCR